MYNWLELQSLRTVIFKEFSGMLLTNLVDHVSFKVVIFSQCLAAIFNSSNVLRLRSNWLKLLMNMTVNFRPVKEEQVLFHENIHVRSTVSNNLITALTLYV